MVSDGAQAVRQRPALPRLNPCSNGIWSLTVGAVWTARHGRVLILVLMEYGL